MNEDDYPALYQSANTLSGEAQQKFFIALFSNLFALVLAAILSVYNIPIQGMAYAQTIILLISLGCTIYIGACSPEKTWYGARALAESTKTITWRYMMRAEPYDTPDPIAKSYFLNVLSKLIDENKEISKQSLLTENWAQISSVMENIRMSSLQTRIDYYQQYRVEEQLTWYVKKASYNKNRAKFFFVALCVVNLLAVIYSFVKIQSPEIQFCPTDIFVALAGAIMAWTQAKRHQELSASYTITAQDVGLVREMLSLIASENEFSDFVGDSENAFSREHTQWLARRDS